MKLSYPEQMRLSVKLAELVGWSNVRTLAGVVVGERRGQRLMIPNYFDRENHAPKAELLAWVLTESLQTQAHFLQVLDNQATGGAVYDAMCRNGVLQVPQMLALLNATPAAVADAIVEVQQLAVEDVELGVAA